MPARFRLWPSSYSAPTPAECDRDFLEHLAARGYGGLVGLEYVPAGDTDEGLAWLPTELRGRWGPIPLFLNTGRR